VKRHVDFLAWLHIAWGIVFLLVALAGGALAAGALAISMGTSPVQPASPMAARLTAFTLLVVSVLTLDLSEQGNYETLAAMGVVLVVIVTAVVAVGMKLAGRDFMLRRS